MHSLHSLLLGDYSFQGSEGEKGSVCLIYLPSLQNLSFGNGCFTYFSNVFIRRKAYLLVFS